MRSVATRKRRGNGTIPRQEGSVRFGRYEVIAELGRGGMATVYLAHDPSIGRDVAVKVLPRALVADLEMRKRFEREARALGRLTHDAIVQVFDSGEEEGQPYLVMEYMAGGSLAEQLVSGPMGITDAALILEPVASALEAAHAAGVIHRDVKPGNILFDNLGRPHIADFGVSRLGDLTTSVTHARSIGTPAYMSPEQCEGTRELTSATDVYALGVVAYQMLTGRLPFSADSPFAVMRQHIQDYPSPPSAWDPALAGVDAVILGALGKRPTTRGGPTEFVRGLQQRTGREASSAVVPLGESNQPLPSRRPGRKSSALAAAWPTRVIPSATGPSAPAASPGERNDLTRSSGGDLGPTPSEVRRSLNRLWVGTLGFAALLFTVLFASRAAILSTSEFILLWLGNLLVCAVIAEVRRTSTSALAWMARALFLGPIVTWMLLALPLPRRSSL